MIRTTCVVLLATALWSSVQPAPAPASSARDAIHRPLDQLLDLYVRDGLVYYRALKTDRRSLDAYLTTLEGTALDGWSREEQVAFWLNAYDALVLRTVINRYPIAGTSREYPSKSIRQIAGAFERTTHKVAGRAVTLDAIEGDILNGFGDPRVFLALGRGSVGGGRLRSEAFTGAQLETQLQQVATEFPARQELMRVDVGARRVSVTPIVSWRQASFIAAYADRADPRFATRSPIERALVVFTLPNLLPAERAFLQANEFALVFHDYDWRLNDLTGGAPR
jgi:Protein of unknown function, DUF547